MSQSKGKLSNDVILGPMADWWERYGKWAAQSILSHGASSIFPEAPRCMKHTALYILQHLRHEEQFPRGWLT